MLQLLKRFEEEDRTQSEAQEGEDDEDDLVEKLEGVNLGELCSPFNRSRMLNQVVRLCNFRRDLGVANACATAEIHPSPASAQQRTRSATALE
jgi:hypothetical protein